MSPDNLQFLGTLGAATLALLGIWLSTRQSGRAAQSSDAQALIDQIQEERTEARAQTAAARAETDARMTNAFARIAGLESRERLLLDYVSALRWHIDSGNPPPPPVYPAGLGGAA